MLTRRELENAIAECEKNPSNYNDCQKLATFYTLHDHLFSPKELQPKNYIEPIVGEYGNSDFCLTVQGRPAVDVFAVLDELMLTLQVINPKLYNATLRKIESI